MNSPVIAVVIALTAGAFACKNSDPTPASSSTPTSAASPSSLAIASASEPAAPAASASAPAATAPSLKSFPGTEAGAKALLAEFVKPNADTAGLSKQLRPTPADYKAIFDAPTATTIDSVYSKEWDKGSFVVAPRAGQTEVKVGSATLADLKAGTGSSKDFPGGYKKLATHFSGPPTLSIYRFRFVEPGQEQGNAYDGLAHVNGHWVLIPKPWRGLDDH